MAVTVYGLKNCDTCRKAVKALKDAGVEHRFVDVRADGVSAERLGGWAEAAGWEVLLNRRGTTWRGLDEAERGDLDGSRALSLMEAHPALIKRPVIEAGDEVTVGFSDEIRKKLTSAG